MEALNQTPRLTKLSDFFRVQLCCPVCKSELLDKSNGLYCTYCLSFFPLKNDIFDFRIGFSNDIFDSMVMKKWKKIQDRVENIQGARSYDFYKEIEGVKEIYNDVFTIEGTILDIGGHQGRLRHFLKDYSKYICIDPFIDAFEKIKPTKGLTDAYPCLLDQCNFVAGYGEHLPFNSEIFDWVHMRSVLDHVYSPFAVIKESVRVLKKGGKILIGTLVIGGKSSISDGKFNIIDRIKKRIRDDGISGFVRSAKNRVESRLVGKEVGQEHMKVWKYEELLALVSKWSGLKIEKIHWQKPPDDHCVYISCVKP